MTGDGGPVCHLVQSPLFTIFLALSRSSGIRDGCFSPQLGQSSDLCFSSLGSHSSGPSDTQGVVGGSDDPDRSALASTSLVPRPSGSGSGSSDRSPTVSRSSQAAALPSSSSRDPQAVSSCLEPLQRFARAEGFSRVAAQVGLAHRHSSQTIYQIK